MNKKHYRLIALATLIGAPMLVNLLSSILPGPRDGQPVELAPVNSSAPSSPTALLPPPLAPPPEPNEQPMTVVSNDGPMIAAMPVLDPGGVSVTPNDAPTPASAQAQHVPDRAVAMAQRTGPSSSGPPLPKFLPSTEGPTYGH